MVKIRAEIEVPNGEYCESADNVCPMCLPGNWGKYYCCLFGADLEAYSENDYYCKRCEQCKQSEVEEMKAAREERVEFEKRIGLLNNELNRELFEHKAFIEKTAIEVGRLKAEKERVVKDFAEKLKERIFLYGNIIYPNGSTFSDIITGLLKEFESNANNQR